MSMLKTGSHLLDHEIECYRYYHVVFLSLSLSLYFMYIYVNYPKTVGGNYSLCNSMVNYGTIITLQGKCHMKKHPVTRVLHLSP